MTRTVSFRPSLAFVLLCLLLVALWLAGGASRGTADGQIFVRATAFLALILQCVFGRLPAAPSAKPVWLLLGAALLIAAIQLVPLPLGFWQSFPNRDIVGGVPVAGPERSWALVPGGALNALGALVVPLAVLVLMTALLKEERAWLPSLVLAIVVASMLLGLLQFSGAPLYDPLVNYTPGIVSGTFANHNHFALCLALGCLMVPVWMFREGRRLAWRGPVGLGLLLLFALVILASGSRAGLMLGALAMFVAGVLSWRDLRRELWRAPRWVMPGVIAGIAFIFLSFVFASVAMDRAVSIQRILSLDVGQDMRSRAFSTVWHMTRAAFPVGVGLGGFDAAFRAHEPFSLLKPTYFNQAHNDFIEVVLDTGLPGLLLLLVAMLWWAWASIRAWRDLASRRSILPRLGSAMLLLVILASVIDYPARTPLIMAMMVIAAVWLSSNSDDDTASALPRRGQHL